MSSSSAPSMPPAPPSGPSKAVWRRWWFWVAAVVVLAVIGAAAGAGDNTDEEVAAGSPTPAVAETPEQPADTETPEPTEAPAEETEAPYLTNLTSGRIGKSGSFTTTQTAVYTPPTAALALVHVFACCGSTPPAVAGNGLVWDLVVGNQAGDKRHWVYRAATGTAPTAGRLTVTFPVDQDRALWIVDAAFRTALGNNGADAIVQTAFQESQTNASSGEIELAPFEDPLNNAAVGFGLCGSGAATNIVPEPGFAETAEAETYGANIIIDTFWRLGEDLTVSAEFRGDSDWSLQVQSWLFLAIELRAA